MRIQFHEPPGISLTPALQKEIEKHFTRGELRRVGYNEVGSITYPARVRESYAHDLLGTLDTEAIRARGFRIVVDYGYSGASFVLPLVLGPLGVEAVAAHAFITDRDESQADVPELIEQTKRLVAALGADLGVVLRPGGRAPLPRRRARAGDPARPRAPALPPAARLERAPRQARVPGHGDEPGRAAARGQRARDRPNARLARRADEGRGRRTASSSRGRSAAATSSRSSSRATTPSRASRSSSSCSRRSSGRCPSSSHRCRSPRSCTTRSTAPGR